VCMKVNPSSRNRHEELLGESKRNVLFNGIELSSEFFPLHNAYTLAFRKFIPSLGLDKKNQAIRSMSRYRNPN